MLFTWFNYNFYVHVTFKHLNVCFSDESVHVRSRPPAAVVRYDGGVPCVHGRGRLRPLVRRPRLSHAHLHGALPDTTPVKMRLCLVFMEFLSPLVIHALCFSFLALFVFKGDMNIKIIIKLCK